MTNISIEDLSEQLSGKRIISAIRVSDMDNGIIIKLDDDSELYVGYTYGDGLMHYTCNLCKCNVESEKFPT